jgi:hypothetical protein
LMEMRLGVEDLRVDCPDHAPKLEVRGDAGGPGRKNS